MILVTGASGALGPAIVSALCEKKYKVRAFCRNQPVKGVLPDEVEIHRGDVTDPSDVKSAMKDVEAVIHLAALLHIIDPPGNLSGLYEKVNVYGTFNVVNESIRRGLKRLVFFSTISVYGNSGGRILDEDSPLNLDTHYSRSKLKAEKIVLDAKANDLPIGTVLRFGAVYGPRVKGNYQKLLMALAKHHFFRVGTGLNRRTLIYDKDAANAAILALNNPHAAGRVFNVSDGCLHTLNEIIDAMCSALGSRKPTFILPSGPFRTATVLWESISRFIGIRPVVTTSMIDKYLEDMAVRSDRFQEETGFIPQYGLLKGWQETVDEMRRCGDLPYKT